MRRHKKMLVWLAIGVVGIGSITVSAANIAIISEPKATVIKQNKQTVELKAGDRVKMVLDEDFSKKNIAKVDMNGTYGYINKAAVHLKEIMTVIIEEEANLRKEPSPDAEIIEKLNENDKVTAYYKYFGWYAVKTESGQRGFVYESQIDEEFLYLLDRQNMVELQENLKKFSGASSRPIEVVDWSEASRILPRGGTAVIEDVYSGKRFSIKRTFGTNHADVETLTAADTAIMKQIWGGFNWQRRPVIVHVAGRRLAASMAGMPHAGKDSAPNLAYVGGRSNGYGYGQNLDAVKGNNMDGVCDLHFRGSRKHKDGRISATTDPLHQAAVSVAASYKR